MAASPTTAVRGYTFTAGRGARDGKPLVVLLGWVNAQDKHLLKYAEQLSAAGYSSVRATPPTTVGFSPFQAHRNAWTRALLTRIATDHPGTPVVLFAFSNGGAWVVESTWLLVQSAAAFSSRHQPSQPHQQLPAVAGVVFDSSPAYMHVQAGAKAIGATLPLLPRLLAAAAFYLVLLPLGMLVSGYRPGQFWRHMQSFSFDGAPELYLYSHSDPMCDAHALEQLIAHRQSRGAAITTLSWPDSPHVAHARANPEQYWKAVQDFLKKLCIT